MKDKFVFVAISGSNSMSVQTAAGEVIPAEHYEDGLAKFKRLPPEKRKAVKEEQPQYALPVPPRGLVLRSYSRGFERTADGELGPQLQASLAYRRNEGPNRDFLWLTEAEWKSLVPKMPQKGQKHPVAAIIARRIFCNHLASNPTSLTDTLLPAHLRSGKLSLTVEEVTAADVRMRLDGYAMMANAGDLSRASIKVNARFLGFLTYDRKQQALNRFDILVLGDTYRHQSQIKEATGDLGIKNSYVLGLAFELATPDSLGYGTEPFGLWLTNSASYASAEKRLADGAARIRQYFGTNPYRPKQ